MIEAVTLSVKNCKYKTTCLTLWSNSSFSDHCEINFLFMSHSTKQFLLNVFLTYAKEEWKKLDSKIRNAVIHASFPKMLLTFIRSTGNSTCRTYDPLGISRNTNSEITLLTSWIRYVLVLWKLSLHFIWDKMF